MTFKTKYSFEERYNEAHKIIEKYPDRIPIICEKNEKSKHTPEIDKNKYLVPIDLTIAQFMYVIRKRIHLKPEEAIFLFINGMIPPASCFVSEIYELYKDPDGFLYCIYSYENVFG